MALKQTSPSACATCRGEDVELVLVTTIATYWRCGDCGSLWFVEHEPHPIDSELQLESDE